MLNDNMLSYSIHTCMHILMYNNYNYNNYNYNSIAAKYGAIRIVGNSRSGELQFYNGSNWGSVCKDGFYDDAGDVACRELGYLRFSGVYFYAKYVTLLTVVNCVFEHIAIAIYSYSYI